MLKTLGTKPIIEKFRSIPIPELPYVLPERSVSVGRRMTAEIIREETDAMQNLRKEPQNFLIPGAIRSDSKRNQIPPNIRLMIPVYQLKHKESAELTINSVLFFSDTSFSTPAIISGSI